MRVRPVIAIAASAALGLGAVGIGAATAGASAPAKKPPVKLDGKVNNHGTKTVKGGAIEVETDDFYFNPTFIKAKAGETVSVTVKNEGSSSHTFTADDDSFDATVDPGKEKTVEVTITADGKPVAFHCDFHEGSGMKGAFFTKSGASAKSGGTKTSTSSGGGYGGY
jgi:plastocyanin